MSDTSFMTYRINYGNGQVGPTKSTYAEARRELVSLRHIEHAASFRIEQYDGGGKWSTIGKAGRLAFDGREGL